jgi:hypothetical protein
MSIVSSAQKFVGMLLGPRFYCEDFLITSHNHDFLRDPAFTAAYARAKVAVGQNYDNRWRLHTALWAARCASWVAGDFVECGVNYGSNSSAIMHDLNWDSIGKVFWLIDSFGGVDPEQSTDTEVRRGKKNQNSHFYNTNLERCKANFSEWKNARVIKGWLPEGSICTH